MGSECGEECGRSVEGVWRVSVGSECGSVEGVWGVSVGRSVGGVLKECGE